MFPRDQLNPAHQTELSIVLFGLKISKILGVKAQDQRSTKLHNYG